VVGLTAAVRTWGPKYWAWLGERRGTLTVAAGSALALSVAQQLLAGEVSVLGIAVTAAVAAFGAIGVHSGVKNGVQGDGGGTVVAP